MGIDILNFDTSKVTDMHNMFYVIIVIKSWMYRTLIFLMCKIFLICLRILRVLLLVKSVFQRRFLNEMGNKSEL